MLRVFTFEERVTAFRWPDGSEAVQQFFKNLSAEQMGFLLSHFKKTDKNTLPIDAVIQAALDLKAELRSYSEGGKLHEIYSESRLDRNVHLEGCRFHILAALPADTQAYRNSYILLLKPDFKPTPHDQMLKVTEAILSFLEGNKRPLFITLAGKFETVPLTSMEEFLTKVLELIHRNPKLAKGFTLENLKDLSLDLSGEDIEAMIVNNGGHTPLRSNAIEKTIKWLEQQKLHESLADILAFPQTKGAALLRKAQKALNLQIHAAVLDINIRCLCYQSYNNQLNLLKEWEAKLAIIQASRKPNLSVCSQMSAYISYLKRLDNPLRTVIPTFFSRPVADEDDLSLRGEIFNKIKKYLTSKSLSSSEVETLKTEICEDLGIETKTAIIKIRKEKEKARRATSVTAYKKLNAFVVAIHTWLSFLPPSLNAAKLGDKFAILIAQKGDFFSEVLKVPQSKRDDSGLLVTWSAEHIHTLFSILFTEEPPYLCAWQTLRREAERKWEKQGEKKGQLYDLINSELPVRDKDKRDFYNYHQEFIQVMEAHFTEEDLKIFVQAVIGYPRHLLSAPSSTRTSSATTARSSSSSSEVQVEGHFVYHDEEADPWHDFGEMIEVDYDASSDEESLEVSKGRGKSSSKQALRVYENFTDLESYLASLELSDLASHGSSPASSIGEAPCPASSSSSSSNTMLSTQLIINRIGAGSRAQAIQDILKLFNIKSEQPDLLKKLDLNLPDVFFFKIKELLHNRMRCHAVAKVFFEELESCPPLIELLKKLMVELQGRFLAAFIVKKSNPVTYYSCHHSLRLAQLVGKRLRDNSAKTPLQDFLVEMVQALGAFINLLETGHEVFANNQNVKAIVTEIQAALDKIKSENPDLSSPAVKLLEDFKDKVLYFLIDECLSNFVCRLVTTGNFDFDKYIDRIYSLLSSYVPALEFPVLASPILDLKRAFYSVIDQPEEGEIVTNAYSLVDVLPQDQWPILEKILKDAGVLHGFQSLSQLKKMNYQHNAWKLKEIDEFLISLGQAYGILAKMDLVLVQSEQSSGSHPGRRDLIEAARKGTAFEVKVKEHLHPFLAELDRNIILAEKQHILLQSQRALYLSYLKNLSANLTKATGSEQVAMTRVLCYCAALVHQLSVSSEIQGGVLKYFEEQAKEVNASRNLHLLSLFFKELKFPSQEASTHQRSVVSIPVNEEEGLKKTALAT